MKTFVTYAMVAAMATLTFGCKKDSETPAPAKTKTELLVDKDWVLTDVKVKQGTSAEASIYGLIAACSRDDKYRFAKPNVVTISAGATPCASAPSSPGTWAFTSNESKITLTNFGDALVDGEYDVVELTESSMKISGSGTQGGTPFTTTGIFSKQ